MPNAPKKNVERTTENEDAVALVRALVERKALNMEQAKSALKRLKSSKGAKTLEALLLESDMVKEEVILESKASLWNVPFIDLGSYEIDSETLDLVPAQLARKYKFFPLFRINGALLIAMTDPKDVKAIDEVAKATKLEVSPALSSKQAVEEAIDRYYGEKQGVSVVDSSEELQGILEVIEAEEKGDEEEATTQDLERLAEEAPVVKMTNMVLVQAIMEGASDIHINPEENQLRVRFRVDGVLQDSFHLPKNLQNAVVSRIKILSSLDIAEHRIPQDGQMRLRLKDGREIDIRVSTLPSAHGENVVLRILDKSAALLNLENLGFETDVFETITKLLSNAYGIILVTGPTGSGKTTTLYAALNRLNAIEKNIITLEDPVEYRLPLIRQSQVNYKAGMTFAKGLRAILRQDPDIVMVGEIRDSETANIAVQAALTGHLVLSTLHTNDASGAITRLAEMDIEPFLISSAILGVQAQRLVRKICSDCKEEFRPSFEIPEEILESEILENFDLDMNSLICYRGKGCNRCRDTGYRGRSAIMEVLPMTDGIRELVLKSAPTDAIKKTAVAEGMRPLLHDGWVKVLKGITTIDEVVRVTNIG